MRLNEENTERQNRKIHKYCTKLCQMNDKPRKNYQADKEHQSQQNDESYTTEKIYKIDLENESNVQRQKQLDSDSSETKT